MGILVGNGAAGSITPIITDNYISGWTNGINVVGSVTQSTIQNNNCNKNSANGIWIQTGNTGNMLIKNTCNSNKGDGFLVQSSPNTLYGNTAKYNVIANYNVASGNVLINNT